MEHTFFHGSIPASPKQETYLDRPQVQALLEQALKSAVVSVTAGAGYGKTQAVYSCLQKFKAVTFWLQLSDLDNLETRFWENYTHALSAYNKTIGAAVASMGFPKTPRQYDRYASFRKEKTIPGRKYVVVLDDFHLIHAPAILRFVERSAALPLFNYSLILISRTEPAINTVQLLSKGLLTRITAEDLRFSEQEIGGYFESKHIPLSLRERSQIYRDTEGWAMAINLIAQESEGRQDRHSRTRIIMGAFKKIEEDFFEGLAPTLRKFLIKLSLIEHWPSSLLENLADNTDLIPEMEKIGSFIRYDAYQGGYQLHHLFIEFLSEKQGELSDEERREVYTKTAAWCIANNQRMDAAINYEKARDYRGILDIICSFPWTIPADAAAFLLDILDRLLPGAGDDDEDVLFLRHAAHAKLLMTLGRLTESIEENQRTIKKFEALPPSPLRSRILTASCNILGVISILTCMYTRNYNFAVYFEQADKYYTEYPHPVPEPETKTNVCSYACRTGHPTEAGEFERSIEGLIPAIPHAMHTMNGALYGMDSLAWTELAYFKADLNAAEQYARQAVFRAREKGQYEIENRGLFFLLRINLHTGSYPAIQELFRQLDSQIEIEDYNNRYTIYDIVTGWFYAQIGEVSKAAPWLQNDFEESEINTLLHSFEVLVKAKCAFADGRYTAVLSTLEEERTDKYGLGGFLLGKLEMTVLQAASLYHLAEAGQETPIRESPVRVLEAAYDLALSNNLDMPFIELGEDMRILAGAALNDPGCTIPRSWLGLIRGKASAYAKKCALVAEQFRSQKQEPEAPILTLREQKVLTALSQGLTREEIAADSAMSQSTVKGVITELYTKLQARSRADAIRIATHLGLLP
jgi:LuxR family maltose regulon positive regulatory protein